MSRAHHETNDASVVSVPQKADPKNSSIVNGLANKSCFALN